MSCKHTKLWDLGAFRIFSFLGLRILNTENRSYCYFSNSFPGQIKAIFGLQKPGSKRLSFLGVLHLGLSEGRQRAERAEASQPSNRSYLKYTEYNLLKSLLAAHSPPGGQEGGNEDWNSGLASVGPSPEKGDAGCNSAKSADAERRWTAP